ncbi:hypothetical protein H0N98_04865 [Candidatus Micrarchaeota archaeon]|nr:hypothetical protein [Candidatus Micrarchaeota archaeon]
MKTKKRKDYKKIENAAFFLRVVVAILTSVVILILVAISTGFNISNIVAAVFFLIYSDFVIIWALAIRYRHWPNLNWNRIYFQMFLACFFSVLFLAFIKNDLFFIIIFILGAVGAYAGIMRWTWGDASLAVSLMAFTSLLAATLFYWFYNALDFSHLYLLLLSILASLTTSWAYRKVTGRETPFKYIQYKR